MKTNILYILILLLLPLSACKKKENTPKTNTNSTSTNSFKLKKDGVPYHATVVSVSLIDEDLLGVEAYKVYQQVDNNTYAVIIRKSIAPGTYALEDGESDLFAIYHIQDSNTVFGWSHGSLTVLSNDSLTGVMHCTFEVTLFNDEIDQYPEVTDGEMTIHY